MNLSTALILAFALGACERDSSGPTRAAPEADPKPAPEAVSWLLTGTSDERFARIARQLGGFHVTMAEVGYRYGELYWAGQDQNWEYAEYQLEKIWTAVQNGLERRPKRKPSAQMLEGVMRDMEEAVAAKSVPLFAERFATLTATCNACHRAEQVPFVHIRPPSLRTSPAGPLPRDH